MDKVDILQALSRLGELSQAAGLRLEVSIYGGSAMLLAYDSRAATKDIDAVLVPREAGQRLVQAVARELSLPEDWLNSDVAQFVSPIKEEKRRLRAIEEETGLIVHVPTAKYLLAMKTLACRRPIGAYQGDAEDLRFLIKKIGIRSVDQMQEAVDAFFPNDVITESNRLFLKTLIGEAYEE